MDSSIAVGGLNYLALPLDKAMSSRDTRVTRVGALKKTGDPDLNKFPLND